MHGDASMFIGGLSALLLQSLHPLAMSAVAAHSGYKGDPWGRLQRTSLFLATTTYGAAEDAQRAVDRVKASISVYGDGPSQEPSTTQRIRTCSGGCTSRRSTASGAHTVSTGRVR